jgi:hypothetical protein
VSQQIITAVFKAQDQFIAGLVNADPAILDAILVDTYVDTNEDGYCSDEAGVIDVLASGHLKLTSIEMSDTNVYLYGDAAVMTGIAAQTGAFQSQALTPKIRFTDTFVLQAGRWRVAASQRTTAPG